MSGVYVGLLRGINVGGKRSVPMAALRALVAEAGHTDVQTILQSGNVVFRAASGTEGSLGGDLSARLAARFGFEVPVAVFQRAELERVAGESPFRAAGVDERELYVGFLVDLPAPAAVAALDAERGGADRFAVVGRAVHLWLPSGVARTRLTTDFFDRGLGTVTTVRNARTVAELVGRARALDAG